MQRRARPRRLGALRTAESRNCAESPSGCQAACPSRTADAGHSQSSPVCSIAWHPRVTSRAYEAGGGGAAWSDDGGDSWRSADEGRDRHYTWSVAVDADDPELWYVSASTGPYAAHGGGDPQARIYRSRARRWEALAGGLPEPLPAMPYALVAADGRLFAGLADGQLWEGTDRGERWSACAVEGETVTALRALA